jgi:formylglycine-generating enzyme required for sulfatase activity
MKKLAFILAIMVSANAYSQSNTLLSPREVYVEGNGKEINDFYIFQYELIVREYKKYLELSGDKFDFDNWHYFDGPANSKIMSEDSAMVNVDFYEAVRFANWLSGNHSLQPVYTINGGIVEWDRKANGYRVPTSAEWGWAARGGKFSKGYKYPGSDNLDEVAWYFNNTDRIEKSRSVGQKKPNELGIYDMFGNVSEWCWNPYVIPEETDSNEIQGLKLLNGQRVIPMRRTEDGNRKKIYRVIRGWHFEGDENRLQNGKEIYPQNEKIGENIGIRLVRNAR